MGAYMEPADLEAALGRPRFVALFDDDNDGVPDAAAVAQVILRAETRVNRYAVVAYDGQFPIPPHLVPPEFKAMSIEYAIVISEARAREVVGSETEKRLEALDQDMSSIAKGVTRATTGQPSATAALPGEPIAPPGSLGASLVGFDTSVGCVGQEWFRKEGCR